MESNPLIYPATSPTTLLFVSAHPQLTKTVASVLSAPGLTITLHVSATGMDALTQIYQAPPDLILIDADLADMPATQLSRILKYDPALCKIPLVLLTQGNLSIYERLGELSPIADAFLEASVISQQLLPEIEILLNVFHGLDPSEYQGLSLFRQQQPAVQAAQRLTQLLDQTLVEGSIAQRFGTLLDCIPNKTVMPAMLLSVLENYIDYDVAAIFFHDKTREPRLLSFQVPYHATENLVDEEHLTQWTHDIFEQLKLESNEPWMFREVRHELLPVDIDSPFKPVNQWYRQVYPFFTQGDLTGALVLLKREDINYELLFPFSFILKQLNILMRMRHYYSQAEALTISDNLTGLYTYQHLHWCLEREIRQAKRHQTPLTMAVVHINTLRELNTRGGFALGDAAMRYIGRIFLENVRYNDMLARVGASKIFGLFPNTTVDALEVVMQRIQSKLAQDETLIYQDQEIPLSLNIEIVHLDETVHSASDMIARVEKALLQT